VRTELGQRVDRAYQRLAKALMAERSEQGHWLGELSSSALSTATAVIALSALDRQAHSEPVERGLAWLARHANPDGGWGDTVRSRSNPSTTALSWAALGAAGADARYPDLERSARQSLARQLRLDEDEGPGMVEALVPAIEALYGQDRTFSVPITMALALSGRLGPNGWRQVRSLPFELAVLPRGLFGALRLPVVSYALPALIAIGQVIHERSGRFHPLRRWTKAKTLDVLTGLQPANGGFLEATPLTSFVTMSLAGMGLGGHSVARLGGEFLRRSARADGSWPIDTNLATWVTTLSIKALRRDPTLGEAGGREPLRTWLLSQQFRNVHPYTGAAPGGWAWTDLPGGVPDADDTSGALVALKALGEPDREVIRSAAAGTDWLLDLQNGDGGMPTFCRGWGTLPFDRSTPEITAHALRAWSVWNSRWDGARSRRVRIASERAWQYLRRTQRYDGSWLPLWFGNEATANQENPVYGTAQTLVALNAVAADDPKGGDTGLRARAAGYLAGVQKRDGSWGGDSQSPSSLEETAVAVEALCGVAGQEAAWRRGLDVLVDRLERVDWGQPAPIGLYFARLWYFERLYPLVFAGSALAASLESEDL